MRKASQPALDFAQEHVGHPKSLRHLAQADPRAFANVTQICPEGVHPWKLTDGYRAAQLRSVLLVG